MRSIKTITDEEIVSDPAYVTAVILIGGSDEATVTLDDSADGGGEDRIALKVAANTTKTVFLGDKGVTFDTAVYSTITGTGAVAYVYVR